MKVDDMFNKIEVTKGPQIEKIGYKNRFNNCIIISFSNST